MRTEKSKLEIQLEYIDKAAEALKARYPQKWPPLAFVHSYGCQQNVSDGEKLKGILAEIGYGFTDSAENADIVIYNTCAVREHAEDRVYGNVGELKHIKQKKSDMLIGLCGCMMQQDQVVEKIKKSFPYVDMVFGTHSINRFAENIYNMLSKSEKIIDNEMDESPFQEGLPIRRDGSIKAWLPIMYGCDNFCTYCIVPYVRGRERSRTSESIINEAKSLISNGYKEITLLGQNVNSYGKGLDENVNFSELLRKINDIDGDFRVRFMTSHPKDATAELIDTIADCNKVCNHLHLPVQSGNNNILNDMNRRYTREKYLELISYAKEKIPNIGLSSDIIVGFPGETRSQFLDTLSLIKEIRYDMLFSFIYSARQGTKAAEMPDPVTRSDKSTWLRELLSVQETISYENNMRMIGTVQRVLFDGIGKGEDAAIQGRTESNCIVEVVGDSDLIGKFANVKIEKARNWSLTGTVV